MIDLTKYNSSAVVAVNAATPSDVNNPLHGATKVELFIEPSSEEIFTVTLEDGTSYDVASGTPVVFQGLPGLDVGQRVCQVQTSVSSINLIIVAHRETR